MAVVLARELIASGVNMSADDFRELIMEIHVMCHSAWSIDELVCHPRIAERYCQIVRNRLQSDAITDDLILRTLMNSRRAGGAT